MALKPKRIIFTDADIDGAGSYLVWSWFTAKRLPYKTCQVNDFKKTFTSWMSNNNVSDYEIYIFDLDVSQDEATRKLVDRDNVTIFDHHTTHVKKKHLYKNAKIVIREYTSCTRLIYDTLKNTGDNHLTEEQKLLVLLVDDYDCYELKIPQSYSLNVIFWNYQGDRLKKFTEEYYTGFHTFSDQQKRIINFYKKKFEGIRKDIDIHSADIPIGKQVYKFVSVFADSCINEIAEYIIKNYKADVGLVINLNSKKVSLRKAKDCKLDLGSFATKLFTVGGGHDYAAGGIIDEKFGLFSSVFRQYSPIERKSKATT